MQAIVNVGPSDANSKTVTVPDGYTCPHKVSKITWLGGDTYDDTFMITQSGDKGTVKRSDSNHGWGMYLRFRCKPKGFHNGCICKSKAPAGCNCSFRTSVQDCEGQTICQWITTASTWMEAMEDMIADKTILDLSLPATHDTLTYDLDRYLPWESDLNPRTLCLLKLIQCICDAIHVYRIPVCRRRF